MDSQNSNDTDRDVRDSEAFINHLQILQSNISRFASNSANCKVCAVSIATALVALDTTNNMISPVFSILIIGLLLLTDAYYLGLERTFISVYDDNVRQPRTAEIYEMPKIDGCQQFCDMICGLGSFSTSPFYIILGLLIWIFIK